MLQSSKDCRLIIRGIIFELTQHLTTVAILIDVGPTYNIAYYKSINQSINQSLFASGNKTH